MSHKITGYKYNRFGFDMQKELHGKDIYEKIRVHWEIGRQLTGLSHGF